MSINELYAAVRAGDAAAERELFKRLSESFRLFAQHRVGDERDVEEVVQEALMTITRKHRSVDFETSFMAWAYRILDNKILECYRARERRRRRFTPMADHDVQVSSKDFDLDLKRLLLQCLKKVGAINRRFTRVLGLHYQGYTTDDICEQLGLSRNGVYILLSRARSMLKTCLEEGGIRQ